MFNTETPTGDSQEDGVEYACGFFWTTGRGLLGPSPPGFHAIYQLDLAANLIATHPQTNPGGSPNGHYDMAMDEANHKLYAGEENGFLAEYDFAWNPAPNGVLTFNQSYTIPGVGTIRALAYDPATQHFFTANFAGSIFVFTINPVQVVAVLPNPGKNFTGFGWDDVNNRLWGYSRDPQVDFNGINPATGALIPGLNFTGIAQPGPNLSSGCTVFRDPAFPCEMFIAAMTQSAPDMVITYDLTIPAPLACGPESLGWNDDFDSYSVGQDPTQPSMNGWFQWDLGTAPGASVSSAQAYNGPRSLSIGRQTDAIVQFNEAIGTVRFSTKMFVPSSGPNQLLKDQWFIVMNTYVHGTAAPKAWSLQLQFDPATGNWMFLGGGSSGQTGPYLANQWAELEVQVDLINDVGRVFYGPPGNTSRIGSPFQWSTGGGMQGGALGMSRFAAIDLWSNNQPTPSSVVFYDDMHFHGPGTPISTFCTSKAGLVCGVPTISASGISSVAATSGFTISAGPARDNRSGILLYNSGSVVPGVSFQGGTLCIPTMGLRRAGSTNSQGSCPPTPIGCAGTFAIDMNSFAASAWIVPDCAGNPSGIGSNNPAAFLSVPGTNVVSQFWGRDSQPTGSFVSNGLEWNIGP